MLIFKHLIEFVRKTLQRYKIILLEFFIGSHFWNISIKKELERQSEKVSQNDYFLDFFHLEYYFIKFLFSESVNNFISNKSINRIKLIDFLRLEIDR